MYFKETHPMIAILHDTLNRVRYEFLIPLLSWCILHSDIHCSTSLVTFASERNRILHVYIRRIYKTWSTSLKLIRLGHFFISKSLSGTIKQACFLERVGRASLVVLQFFFIVCFKLQQLWCVFWPEDTSASMRPRKKWRMNEMC